MSDLKKLRRLTMCVGCGQNRMDNYCSDCITADTNLIDEWHQRGEMSNSDGSWDICLRCHDGWPCDAVKAMIRVKALEDKLAEAGEWHKP